MVENLLLARRIIDGVSLVGATVGQLRPLGEVVEQGSKNCDELEEVVATVGQLRLLGEGGQGSKIATGWGMWWWFW